MTCMYLMIHCCIQDTIVRCRIIAQTRDLCMRNATRIHVCTYTYPCVRAILRMCVSTLTTACPLFPTCIIRTCFCVTRFQMRMVPSYTQHIAHKHTQRTTKIMHHSMRSASPVCMCMCVYIMSMHVYVSMYAYLTPTRHLRSYAGYTQTCHRPCMSRETRTMCGGGQMRHESYTDMHMRHAACISESGMHVCEEGDVAHAVVVLLLHDMHCWLQM